MMLKQRVVFRLCDAVLELRTNEAEIAELIRRFYSEDQSVDSPDIRLNLEWRRSSSRRFEPPPLSEGWVQMGRWIFVRGGDGRHDDARLELICAFPGAGGLTLRFRRGEGLDIEAVYHYSAPRRFVRWLMNLHRGKRRRSVRQQLLHHILRFVMYYPLFWHLRRYRGLEVLHAGAVEVDGVGVVLAGLSGVGKSRITFSLLSLEGTKFVSDNLLLFNNEKVFSCPEPLRLFPSDFKALPDGGSRLRRLGGAEVCKCNRFKISPGETAEGFNPAHFFFPCFADKSFLREMSMEEAVARLLATADPTGVMSDYRGFQFTLDLAFPAQGRRPDDRRELLANLLRDARCWVLGVRKGEEMKDVIERYIMPVISEARRKQ